MKRRVFLGALGAGGLAAFAGNVALAQNYPTKQIIFIAPSTPGGGVDFLTRSVGEALSKRLNVAVVVENRPGTDMLVPAQQLMRSQPDGYTLMLGYSAMVTSPFLNPAVTYRPLEDFTPVSVVGHIPLAVVANPKVPVDSMRALIELARSRPGQIGYASGGAGAGNHIAAELLKYREKIEIPRIPYVGEAAALTDVLGGHAPFTLVTITAAVPHIKAGTLKALAVTSAKRSGLAPDIPTMIEAGVPDFDVSAWYIVLAPAGTPAPVVAKLNGEIQAILDTAEFKAMLQSRGVDVAGGSAQDARTFLEKELARWSELLKSGAIKLN